MGTSAGTILARSGKAIRLGRDRGGVGRLVALLLGIMATELQARPGIPVLLKKRDLLELNGIETYLEQLGARVKQEG